MKALQLVEPKSFGPFDAAEPPKPSAGGASLTPQEWASAERTSAATWENSLFSTTRVSRATNWASKCSRLERAYLT